MTWDDVVALVNEQAEDEGLWFMAETAPEAYLQQELRRLHAAIEAAGQPDAPCRYCGGAGIIGSESNPGRRYCPACNPLGQES